MKKQTLIITGASSGIGKEIARYFLKNNYNVVLNSLTAEKSTEVFHELGGGENLAMVSGNVSERITGIKLLATAVARFGSADVLVNNSGIIETRPFFQVDEAYLNRFLDTNFKGVFFTTQGVIPQMLKQGKGVVINIGMPLISKATGGPALLADKGDLHSLTLQMAAEFSKHNIRFNTITPGTVSTFMHGDTDDQPPGLKNLNHLSEVQELAKAVYTIAKSNLIAGTIIKLK